MPRNALLAAVALLIAVSAGNAAQAAMGSMRYPQVLIYGSGAGVHRTVVMFGLAMLRRHLLDTLTELVGRPAALRLPRSGWMPARAPDLIVSR